MWSPENLSGSLLRKVYYATVRIQKSLLCHGTDSETAPELRPSDTNYGGCDRNYQSPSLMSSRKSRAQCSRLNQCFFGNSEKRQEKWKSFLVDNYLQLSGGWKFHWNAGKVFSTSLWRGGLFPIYNMTAHHKYKYTKTNKQIHKYTNTQVWGREVACSQYTIWLTNGILESSSPIWMHFKSGDGSVWPTLSSNLNFTYFWNMIDIHMYDFWNHKLEHTWNVLKCEWNGHFHLIGIWMVKLTRRRLDGGGATLH